MSSPYFHDTPASSSQPHAGWCAAIDTCTGSGINARDLDFRPHLREAMPAQAWRGRNPATDGIVTSIERFGATGESIACFSGDHMPVSAETPVRRILAKNPAPR